MLLSEQQIEARLAAAARRGEFDNLPGAGRPLVLDDDREVPEALRMAYRVMKNSGFVPEAVRLRGEIASVEALLHAADDEAARQHAARRLRVLLDRLNQNGEGRGLISESGYFRQLCERLEREA
ncbi:DnaJ family domain-containing protein [Thioalkalivibrio sp. ALJ16]|uniref:DnaJ family domain-containing protein n=1 Tax=Thioalkalivibrio sp. ALJ16 TaxID=1158762 RepID=UPI00037D50D5|nr:DnaJ family domain-containing protein [Thioalkalivibrio sp. ALJ16]